ncbi:MAG: tRNA dihydrouridine synthase DusB [Streptosporangiales bacterium]|nr:tRNA dihydrouridine synthase DusB [Streptosporangiales bacterium]MBO0889416.1 tRNA dihydrouridine synthase DusB [Acidothermales bacterium]
MEGFRALKVGPYVIWPPVELAPMAGVTNAPYRILCREYGAGLFVSEMVTARALVERHPTTLRMVRFEDGARPRSVQLYGVDPVTVARAVEVLVEDDLADHVDLNFGCPVPKVTGRGGGSALPYRRPLLRRIVRAAVRAAGTVPVTVKMRKGIDESHLTYLDAGRIAEDEGAATVALHARTAAQHYSGEADWAAIARLKEAVSIPVLGNGDVWEASDAVAMMRATGCDGVVVGRGCLGRPWLFRDLADAFDGRERRHRPSLGEVVAVMRRHAQLLAADVGEDKGVREFRKHVAWYLKGFPVGTELRRSLATASTLAELDDLAGALDPHVPWPTENESVPRGRQGGPRRVALPEGWLDDPDDPTPPTGEAELDISGG